MTSCPVCLCRATRLIGYKLGAGIKIRECLACGERLEVVPSGRVTVINPSVVADTISVPDTLREMVESS